MNTLKNRYPLTVTGLSAALTATMLSVDFMRIIDVAISKPVECDMFTWSLELSYVKKGYKNVSISVQEIIPGSLIHGVTIDNVVVKDSHRTLPFLTDSTFQFGQNQTKYTIQSVVVNDLNTEVSFDIINNGYLKFNLESFTQDGFPLDSLYGSEDFSVITIKVNKKSEKTVGNISLDSKEKITEKPTFFAVHKNILSAASFFFKRMFTVDMKESQQNTISLYEVDPVLFEKLLKFCYLFPIDITDYKEGCALLKLNDYLGIRRLSDIISKQLYSFINSSNVWHISSLL